MYSIKTILISKLVGLYRSVSFMNQYDKDICLSIGISIVIIGIRFEGATQYWYRDQFKICINIGMPHWSTIIIQKTPYQCLTIQIPGCELGSCILGAVYSCSHYTVGHSLITSQPSDNIQAAWGTSKTCYNDGEIFCFFTIKGLNTVFVLNQTN